MTLYKPSEDYWVQGLIRKWLKGRPWPPVTKFEIRQALAPFEKGGVE